MKTAVKFLAAIAIVFISQACVYAQGKLQVKVTNIKAAKGSIRIGLFNSEESFLKDAVLGKVVKASADEVTVVFDNLKSGEYALSVIHDENGNEQLDTNMVGIPQEGFAFGNNAMGMFGPPSFEKAKLVIENNKVVNQTISLKYL
jgi:uncharacterized protein (DUF2141 family)